MGRRSLRLEDLGGLRCFEFGVPVYFFLCLFLCLFGWLFGWLVGWLFVFLLSFLFVTWISCFLKMFSCFRAIEVNSQSSCDPMVNFNEVTTKSGKELILFPTACYSKDSFLTCFW